MKLKYSASLALALWLCVVAWGSAMIVAKPSVRHAYSDEEGSTAIAQLQLNIDQNRKALAALDALALAPVAIASSPAVTPSSAAPAGLASDEGTPAEPVVVSHQLTLILSTDQGRRAIVDGVLVRAGERLADGSRVLTIGRDHVSLDASSGERLTLRLPAPFAGQAATGGAR